jgi:Response regulator containing CheY-like receiver, AAA-type ATPase, and DNA-binding domains
MNALIVWCGFKEMRLLEEDAAEAGAEFAKRAMPRRGAAHSAALRVCSAVPSGESPRYDEILVLGDAPEEALRAHSDRLEALLGRKVRLVLPHRKIDERVHGDCFSYCAAAIRGFLEECRDEEPRLHYLIPTAPHHVSVVWIIMARGGEFAGRILDSTSGQPCILVSPEAWNDRPPLDLGPTEELGLERLLGESAAMRRLKREISKAAGYDEPVLIWGESGTGKELVARALHDKHPRRYDFGYNPINCSAISESLFEDAVFGHVKGAYTGADRDRAGLVKSAEGGSLFLDEIGDLPPSQQTKILRLIEYKEYFKVGADRPERADVRFVAASHRNLGAMARRGEFRNDLLQRLKVLTIVVPPLRERSEDIPMLVRKKLDDFIRVNDGNSSLVARDISEEALYYMTTYSWPGNVRQLNSTLVNALVFAEEEVVGLADIKRGLSIYEAEEGPLGGRSKRELPRRLAAIPLKDHLQGLEREYLLQAIPACRNIAELTRELGYDNAGSVRNLLRKHGIDDPYR